LGGASIAARQFQLKLKTPRRDSTNHMVMTPPEFMQRLAALVPRPRLHLIRFHGVLTPNAKLRALVTPQGPEKEEPAAACKVEHAQARPGRIGWARLLKRVFDIDMHHCLPADAFLQVPTFGWLPPGRRGAGAARGLEEGPGVREHRVGPVGPAAADVTASANRHGGHRRARREWRPMTATGTRLVRLLLAEAV
jgi:hypothetical protein